MRSKLCHRQRFPKMHFSGGGIVNYLSMVRRQRPSIVSVTSVQQLLMNTRDRTVTVDRRTGKPVMNNLCRLMCTNILSSSTFSTSFNTKLRLDTCWRSNDWNVTGSTRVSQLLSTAMDLSDGADDLAYVRSRSRAVSPKHHNSIDCNLWQYRMYKYVNKSKMRRRWRPLRRSRSFKVENANFTNFKNGFLKFV